MARKKWVKRRLDPINDHLTELDQINSKNSSDITDVDARAQAGIKQAQDSSDAANQAASAASDQAKNANNAATAASGRVDNLNTTIKGLDQYHQIGDIDLSFPSGTPALSKDAKSFLDDMASKLAGHQGYIIEIEAHSPQSGSAGIAVSQRLATAVEVYLVAEHQIPIYRIHSVALGNSAAATRPGIRRPDHLIRNSVHLRLMEDSLAALTPGAPVFPWPVPKWTLKYPIPTSLVIKSGRRTTQGEALGQIQQALSQAGIDQWSVYTIDTSDGNHGFVVVSRPENITNDGHWKAPRFCIDDCKLESISLGTIFRGLFSSNAGRYRVMAIVVTDLPIQPGAEPPSPLQFESIVTQGPSSLPRAAAASTLKSDTVCQALIYEFYRANPGEPPKPVDPSSLTALQHLLGAGLWNVEELK